VEALAGRKLNRDQEDYLEAVAHFLDEHDRKTQPALPQADGVAVLKQLLEGRDMSGADLSRLLGWRRALGPMILRRERRLTADHVRTLAKVFGVNPAVLL
jgi:antitoxin component HigA of HigAB toxin-antitoxin module